MGLFDGGLFDLDGDGRASMEEDFIAYSFFMDFLHEQEREERRTDLFDDDDEDEDEDD